jgi:geranylgeranyl pyrophosphate synthase
MKLLAMSDGKSYLPVFLNKITEMIETESEQELLLRGKQMDEATSLRIARSKTGSLFAFLGHVCGNGNESLSKTLEETGYLIGAIYQLADDIFDVVSSDKIAGKTLGTDNKRGKLTLPQAGNDGIKATVTLIKEQYFRAIEVLAPYPEKQDALKLFISEDIIPIVKQHDFQIDFTK